MKDLRNKYKHLVAWCNMMGSFDYYIDQQLNKANELNAPKNTIYFRDNKPVTFDEVKNSEVLIYFKQRNLH